MENNKFRTYSGQKLIYIFRINDGKHEGILKIGEATNHGEDINDYISCDTDQLKKDAIKRIGQETITAGIDFDLLYTTIALTKDGKGFKDKTVHKLLKASNIKQRIIKNEAGEATEWFECDLQTAINAINAVKNGRKLLNNDEKSLDQSPIILREEQKRFVKETMKGFTKHKTYLWNAKMRFGKTATALTVAKEMGIEKILIYTHRPVVNDSWFDDYNKVFYEKDKTVHYGSQNRDHAHIDDLLTEYKKSKTPFIYFASLQDLRGKTDNHDWKDRNKKVFDTEWDLVIIDEAHEGNLTELGKAVYKEIDKPKTKILSLSGTPFNLMGEFNEENSSSWDYIMEQESKNNWNYEDGPNPYTCPKMNIFTYNINEALDETNTKVEDNSFTFKEFFRTYTGKVELDGRAVSKDELGKFVHEEKVNKFLDRLSEISEDSNYPYSTEEYRRMFNHTLWMVPGVKEAKALSELLQKHKVFGKGFKIVNVAGAGDEDVENEEALKMVRDAIENNAFTITLSCGRLTTGVTVKEWNAVLYLSGSKNTSAQNYLQTIFRVQSPCIINGKQKENCYVFDFAPDRVLNIVPAVADITTHNKFIMSNDTEKRELLQKVLNFLPVISFRGSSTIEYNVENMMGEIKKATAEKVALEGFDDVGLYNMTKLLTLSKVDIKKFNDLCGIIGKSTKDTPKNITINAQGLSEKEVQNMSTNTKPKTELTPEEKAKREKLLEAQKQRNTAISILRGIAVRIPLLVYGLDADKDEDLDINVDNFTDLVDNDSFIEFMPKGVDKKKFNEFKEFFDKDVFRESCKNIRQRVKDADKLSILDRVYEIADIFSTFRNPDKETVLTPWRVVNKHLQFSLGGYNLYKEDENANPYDNIAHRFEEPPFKDNGEITKDTLLNLDSHILDINSKTGLYSLYVAYSIFKERVKQEIQKGNTNINFDDLWFKTIKTNIYCLCKTPMAKSITLRTLLGFKIRRVNNKEFHIRMLNYDYNYTGVQHIPNFIENVKDAKKQEKLLEILQDDDFWNGKMEIPGMLMNFK